MRRTIWPCLFLAVCTVLSLCVLAVEAPAQGYQNYYTYTQPACYPYYGSNTTYSQSYTHAYREKVYPVQKVVAQEIAVAPLIVTVPVESKAVPVHAYGSPYYYSVSEAYREKAYMREVLREELRNLLGTGGVAPAAPLRTGGYSAPATAPTVATPSATTAPTATLADTTTPTDLQQKVLAAYQGKGGCLNCHSGETAKFKLTLDDGKGNITLVKHGSDKRWKIYGMSSVGAMPPSAASDASKAMETTHLPALLQYAAQKD